MTPLRPGLPGREGSEISHGVTARPIRLGGTGKAVYGALPVRGSRKNGQGKAQVEGRVGGGRRTPPFSRRIPGGRRPKTPIHKPHVSAADLRGAGPTHAAGSNRACNAPPVPPRKDPLSPAGARARRDGRRLRRPAARGASPLAAGTRGASPLAAGTRRARAQTEFICILAVLVLWSL